MQVEPTPLLTHVGVETVPNVPWLGPVTMEKLKVGSSLSAAVALIVTSVSSVADTLAFSAAGGLLRTLIRTDAAALENWPSFTISWKLYSPRMRGVKLGVAAFEA